MEELCWAGIFAGRAGNATITEGGNTTFRGRNVAREVNNGLNGPRRRSRSRNQEAQKQGAANRGQQTVKPWQEATRTEKQKEGGEVKIQAEREIKEINEGGESKSQEGKRIWEKGQTSGVQKRNESEKKDVGNNWQNVGCDWRGGRGGSM